MTNSTIPKDHPQAAFKRVSEKVANGEIKLYHRSEEALEQFLALKLACPSLSDEAAASLLVYSTLDSGVQIAGGR